jgi:hypothetical protein|tara:strand:+ start:107 stop:763 length:657 start_codon:yes stop_codon:yes gene_type:complete
MGTISVEKMAGYCLIIGPIVAVLIYFIQPGGVLGIGGQPDPTDAEAVIKLWTGDLQTYGIVTSMLIPVALITMLSGLMYFVQSLEGGNGYALARLGMPMVFIAVAGWAIGSGLSLGAGIGTVTLTGDRELATIGFSLANLCTFLFGVGGFLIALGASTRDDSSIFASIAALSAVVVVITAQVSLLATGQATTMALIGGICYIVYTVWAITLGRAMISK